MRVKLKGESGIANRRAKLTASGLAEYNARKQEIVRKAAIIFKTKGYQATSVNEIATAAGIDRATLYYYASGKKELFHEVVHMATLANVLIVERIASSRISPLDKIKKLLPAIMVSFKENYPHIFVYVQEDMRKIATDKSAWGKDMRELSKRYDDAVIRIVKEGLDQGIFRTSGPARLIAYGIIGMLNSTHRWYNPARGYTAEEIGEAFAEMVTGGLIAR